MGLRKKKNFATKHGAEIKLDNAIGNEISKRIKDKELPCADAFEIVEKLQVSSGLLRVQDPDLERLGTEIFKAFAVKHNLALELGIGDIILSRGPADKIKERIIPINILRRIIDKLSKTYSTDPIRTPAQ